MSGLAHGPAPPAEPALVALSVVVLAAGGYLWASMHTTRRWNHWRTACWLAGCLLLAASVTIEYPAAVPARWHDPRVHMAQHLLLGMLAPLGLVLATPVTLVLAASRPKLRRVAARMLHSRAMHVITHPATAAALSIGGLYLVMLTPLYAATTHDPVLHHLVHLHYLLAGCLFVWAIAGPDPTPRRPGLATRIVVLVVASAAHSYLAKRLYAGADWLPPGMTGRDPAALQAAAELMYYGGTLADLLLATALFAAWYRRRGRTAARRTGTPRPRRWSRTRSSLERLARSAAGGSVASRRLVSLWDYPTSEGCRIVVAA